MKIITNTNALNTTESNVKQKSNVKENNYKNNLLLLVLLVLIIISVDLANSISISTKTFKKNENKNNYPSVYYPIKPVFKKRITSFDMKNYDYKTYHISPIYNYNHELIPTKKLEALINKSYMKDTPLFNNYDITDPIKIKSIKEKIKCLEKEITSWNKTNNTAMNDINHMNTIKDNDKKINITSTTDIETEVTEKLVNNNFDDVNDIYKQSKLISNSSVTNIHANTNNKILKDNNDLLDKSTVDELKKRKRIFNSFVVNRSIKISDLLELNKQLDNVNKEIDKLKKDEGIKSNRRSSTSVNANKINSNNADDHVKSDYNNSKKIFDLIKEENNYYKIVGKDIISNTTFNYN